MSQRQSRVDPDTTAGFYTIQREHAIFVLKRARVPLHYKLSNSPLRPSRRFQTLLRGLGLTAHKGRLNGWIQLKSSLTWENVAMDDPN